MCVRPRRKRREIYNILLIIIRINGPSRVMACRLAWVHVRTELPLIGMVCKDTPGARSRMTCASMRVRLRACLCGIVGMTCAVTVWDADQALAVLVLADLTRPPSASLLAVACAQDMRSWKASFGHSGIRPHELRDSAQGMQHFRCQSKTSGVHCRKRRLHLPLSGIFGKKAS